jgi:hypothetical protein
MSPNFLPQAPSLFPLLCSGEKGVQEVVAAFLKEDALAEPLGGEVRFLKFGRGLRDGFVFQQAALLDWKTFQARINQPLLRRRLRAFLFYFGQSLGLRLRSICVRLHSLLNGA